MIAALLPEPWTVDLGLGDAEAVDALADDRHGLVELLLR